LSLPLFWTFCVLAIALSGRLDASTSTNPNLVIFIADDLGYRDLSVAGAKDFRMPNFERLARDGVTLTHVFAASPSCAPSRAALLTGLMPIRNGAMRNHQPARTDAKKLPAYLHELGYDVVAIGKVAHYKQGRDYGFDYTAHDTFHDDDCVAAAVEFLEQRKTDKPLCLFVGTNWPHVPWPKETNVATSGKVPTSLSPPQSHVDTPETRRWRARYAAAVERCDRDLGLVYDATFKGLGPNTLFIAFSDQGAQWPFGKWNLYDAGTRTGLHAVWPSVIPPNTRSDALVSLVDVAPTLIEAANGVAPSAIDGQSFLAVLTGKAHTFRGRVFATHSADGKMNQYPMRSVRTTRWKYIRNLKSDAEHHTHIDLGQSVDGNGYWVSWVKRAKTDPHAASVVNRYFRRPSEELYDLDADPDEQRNLAADLAHGKTLEELRASLDNWMKKQGDRGILSEQASALAFPKAAPKPDVDSQE
jgi:uncharacterized sulfatase